jgi:hypothetical protein
MRTQSTRNVAFPSPRDRYSLWLRHGCRYTQSKVEVRRENSSRGWHSLSTNDLGRPWGSLSERHLAVTQAITYDPHRQREKVMAQLANISTPFSLIFFSSP